eukprot:CAMPEP_0202963876 /NCGR_PEP_ID=MMETSP1396-20130829/7918_1 /ASSEMBLY_ACC=CAM_ASM_000872 /TAXON_ID= /ORGANISM="Pseudokeronopsis sp., Strain Brazil" /LENGTH=126 /DNA_ID=CAMNT_0049685493 /DNA_START=78 /DNA_END=458 /DNA_ORIENTATION=-
MLFLKDLRNNSEYAKEQGVGGKGFLVQASKLWQDLEKEKKEEYLEKSRAIKERYLEQVKLEEEKRGQGEGHEEEDDPNDDDQQTLRRKFMQLPMNRIRQIVQRDEECKRMTKEALVLLTKATEMFT